MSSAGLLFRRTGSDQLESDVLGGNLKRIIFCLLSAVIVSCFPFDNADTELTQQQKLFCSIAGNKSLMVDHLLNDTGCDPDCVNEHGITALAYSILYLQYGGRMRIIESLIDNGADVNLTCRNSRSPLIYASWIGHGGAIDLLLRNGADIDYSADSGTALMEAVRRNKPETVRLLLDNGADPRLVVKSGESALILARKLGYGEIEEMFKSAID